MTLPQTNHCCISAGLGTSDLSGLQLEDENRVTIPAKPAFVFAVGAVAGSATSKRWS